MPSRTWTLTDVANELHEHDFCITAEDHPRAAGDWKVTQRVLRGGLSEGVDLVEIDNGRMRLMIVPTRGMGIWRAMIGDQMLGWRSPVRGPVHPNFVPLFEPSGLGWLEGFDELVVRCGLESNGAPEFDQHGQLLYPLHGRIANRPAHFVEVTVDDSAGTITLRGVVEETRFHFQKLRLEASVTTSLRFHLLRVERQGRKLWGDTRPNANALPHKFRRAATGSGRSIHRPCSLCQVQGQRCNAQRLQTGIATGPQLRARSSNVFILIYWRMKIGERRYC